MMLTDLWTVRWIPGKSHLRYEDKQALWIVVISATSMTTFKEDLPQLNISEKGIISCLPSVCVLRCDKPADFILSYMQGSLIETFLSLLSLSFFNAAGFF